MSSRLPRAVISLCVRLDAVPGHSDNAQQEAVDLLGVKLLEMLSSRQIPATWAVGDPATSAVVKRIAASLGGQEVALAVSAASLASGVWGIRELENGVALVRRLGLSLSTVAVDRELVDVEYESLARLGITAATRPGSVTTRFARRRTQAPTPRYGCWCFAVSASLPGASRWAIGGGGYRAAKREIDLAVREQGLVQLSVDVSALMARGRSALHVLARAVELIERRRGLGQLDIAPLVKLAARLSGQCTGKPSRSILRPAA